MVIGMAFFGQWSGNNVVSYFMPEMVKQAGITSTNKQLLINAINPILSMIAGAIYGATLLDKLGRRVIMLISLTGSLMSYVLLTIFTVESANHPSLSYGVIVSIYLFGIMFSWGFTPLQALYSVECLENRTRAKGSGLNFLFLNIAMVVNTYGIAVGIAAIQWRVCPSSTLHGSVLRSSASTSLPSRRRARLLPKAAPEIFNAPNPKQESIKKTKVEIDETGAVVAMDEA